MQYLEAKKIYFFGKKKSEICKRPERNLILCVPRPLPGIDSPECNNYNLSRVFSPQVGDFFSSATFPRFSS